LLSRTKFSIANSIKIGSLLTRKETDHNTNNISSNYDIARSLWEYEQDDVFELFATADPNSTNRPTITSVPTESPTLSSNPSVSPSEHPTKRPTNHPSYSPSIHPSNLPSSKPSITPSDHPTFEPSSQPSGIPTSKPTSSPSVSPTYTPTKYPSISPSFPPSGQPSYSPSLRPSTSPSDSPTKLPTSSPSASPTISKAPSSTPTMSMAPSLLINVVSISMFTIMITTPPNAQEVDPYEVISITEEFLDNCLKEKFSNDARYRGVELNLISNGRRRLQTVTVIPCTGNVLFNTLEAPSITEVDEKVSEALAENKENFEDSLRHSGSAGLQSILDVKTNDSRARNAFNTMHTGIIIACIAILIVGVFASYIWKRNQAQNVRRRLILTAEHNRNSKNKPQMDDDCFNDIMPQPLQLLDDKKSLERMVIRARHDRGVMNRANEWLMQQFEKMSYALDAHKKQVQFAANVGADADAAMDDNGSRNGQISLDASDGCSHSTMSTVSKGGASSCSLINLGYHDIDAVGNQRSPMSSLSRALQELTGTVDDTGKELLVSQSGNSTSRGDDVSASNTNSVAHDDGTVTTFTSLNRENEETAEDATAATLNRGDDETLTTNRGDDATSCTTDYGAESSSQIAAEGNSYFTNLFTRKY